jgi:hypothetical protein
MEEHSQGDVSLYSRMVPECIAHGTRMHCTPRIELQAVHQRRHLVVSEQQVRNW